MGKQREEGSSHEFAIGHGRVKRISHKGQQDSNDVTAGDASKVKTEDSTPENVSVAATKIAENEANAGESGIGANEGLAPNYPAESKEGAENGAPETPGLHTAADAQRASISPSTPGATSPQGRPSEEGSNGVTGTQPAGESVTEAGTEPGQEQQSVSSGKAELTPMDAASSEEQLSDEMAQLSSGAPSSSILKANGGILPDSLAEEVASRAFPQAEGVSCEAFHALAAEAVWAGFNGSNRVEKPPHFVWAPRGGDRWGTAAFFAETIGRREEEVVLGLPRTVSTPLLERGDLEGGRMGGDRKNNRPRSGRAAWHAAMRKLRMAAVSSRRGFLKEATNVAAQEVNLTCSSEVCFMNQSVQHCVRVYSGKYVLEAQRGDQNHFIYRAPVTETRGFGCGYLPTAMRQET